MLLVCIIPSCNTGQEKSPLQYVKDFYGLFPDQPFFESHNFTHADYDKADGHFNEQGHKKYADFLFSIIDSAERSNIKK
ncbi:MAG: hypothetical protein JWO06_3406 [Bacteroidota bacterium]|nr:hypothetical protein [Bacteroidota bacterium]